MRKYIDTFKQRLTESENLNISDVSDSKSYTKDDVIDLIYNWKINDLGKYDPSSDEEWNFTNPKSPNYISLDRIKSKIIDFMKDK